MNRFKSQVPLFNVLSAITGFWFCINLTWWITLRKIILNKYLARSNDEPSWYFLQLALCTQILLLYYTLEARFDSCIGKSHPCMMELLQLWKRALGYGLTQWCLTLTLYPRESQGFIWVSKTLSLTQHCVCLHSSNCPDAINQLDCLYEGQKCVAIHSQGNYTLLVLCIDRFKKRHDQMTLECVPPWVEMYNGLWSAL